MPPPGAPSLAAVLECVVNVSEGRDIDKLKTLAQASGESLVDVHADIGEGQVDGILTWLAREAR